MTEKNDNWFGSWLSAAKNKSSEVLEFVKKDLEEFGNVVKQEASSVMSSTGSVIEKTLKLDSPESTASNMKKSISSFLGQVNTVLNPVPDDSDTEAILIVEGSDTVKLTKLQEAIYKLQMDDSTFLKDPEPELDKQYQCWLEIIDDQHSKESLVKHLTNSEILNNQYTRLVPQQVAHNVFWKRYLFKKALLEDELARQEAMERRKQKEKEVDEESVKWDQEDFANDIELTEEEQIRLLEQYEHETKQKKTPSKNDLIGEKIVFQQTTPPNTPTRTNSEEMPRKGSAVKIGKTDSAISLETVSSSSSSSDGDWEKVNVPEK